MVTVTDANGCQVVNNITIEQPSGLTSFLIYLFYRANALFSYGC